MMMNSKNETKRQTAARRKHIPQRSCIACRETKAKRELVRLVRHQDMVLIDPKGKQPGRGAYLCPFRECWEIGLKGNRLENALRTKLTMENRQMLVEYGRNLPLRGDKS